MIGWISTPRSPICRLLTEPGALPESCTPRQNGALLPGWLRARCALLSPGCGSGSAVVVIVVAVPGATVIDARRAVARVDLDLGLPGGHGCDGAGRVATGGLRLRRVRRGRSQRPAASCCASDAGRRARTAANAASEDLLARHPSAHFARRVVVLALGALGQLRVPAGFVARRPARREKALVRGPARPARRPSLAGRPASSAPSRRSRRERSPTIATSTSQPDRPHDFFAGAGAAPGVPCAGLP